MSDPSSPSDAKSLPGWLIPAGVFYFIWLCILNGVLGFVGDLATSFMGHMSGDEFVQVPVQKGTLVYAHNLAHACFARMVADLVGAVRRASWFMGCIAPLLVAFRVMTRSDPRFSKNDGGAPATVPIPLFFVPATVTQFLFVVVSGWLAFALFFVMLFTTISLLQFSAQMLYTDPSHIVGVVDHQTNVVFHTGPDGLTPDPSESAHFSALMTLSVPVGFVATIVLASLIFIGCKKAFMKTIDDLWGLNEARG